MSLETAIDIFTQKYVVKNIYLIKHSLFLSKITNGLHECDKRHAIKAAAMESLINPQPLAFRSFLLHANPHLQTPTSARPSPFFPPPFSHRSRSAGSWLVAGVDSKVSNSNPACAPPVLRPHSAPAHAACLSIEISLTPLSAIAQLRYGSWLIAEYSMDARSESSCRAFSRRYGTCAVGAVHKSPHCFQEMTVFVCVFHRSRAFTVLSLCSRSYDTININLSGQ